MTIEGGNRLIAEFMEAKPSDFGLPWKVWQLDEIRYNVSWDWLMPVVEKIESIYDAHHGYFQVVISSNHCDIQGTKLYKYLDSAGYGPVYFIQCYGETKIEATWAAVVNFIEWYNLNLKK